MFVLQESSPYYSGEYYWFRSQLLSRVFLYLHSYKPNISVTGTDSSVILQAPSLNNVKTKNIKQIKNLPVVNNKY